MEISVLRVGVGERSARRWPWKAGAGSAWEGGSTPALPPGMTSRRLLSAQQAANGERPGTASSNKAASGRAAMVCPSVSSGTTNLT